MESGNEDRASDSGDADSQGTKLRILGMRQACTKNACIGEKASFVKHQLLMIHWNCHMIHRKCIQRMHCLMESCILELQDFKFMNRLGALSALLELKGLVLMHRYEVLQGMSYCTFFD